MIQIPIDNKNIRLRDLHHRNIKDEITSLIDYELLMLTIGCFKHTILSWVKLNLDSLLIDEINELREKINSFNDLISGYIDTVTPTLPQYNSNLINVEELKQICREDGIANFSNKNKAELSAHIILNQQLISQNNILNNELKFRILEYDINEILEKIFVVFYEKIWDTIDGYNRYTFVKGIGLKTCPYCNRNYIFVVDSSTGNVRPEIDHFFPKSIYPYLGMSFYNLIPSCQACNHTKKAKDAFLDGLKSPYEIRPNTFQFTYKPNNLNFLQVKKRKYNFNDFEIKFKTLDEKNNDYFKLDKLYEQHKDIVLELLIKKTVYSKSYIKDLKRNFKLEEDEVYRFLLCNYKKDSSLHKRPLSKLIKDISIELNLI